MNLPRGIATNWPCCRVNTPDLQSASAEHTRSLVLGQVWSSCALVIWHLLLARLFHHLARVSGIGVTRNDHVVAVHSWLIRLAFDTIVTLETLLVDEILGFVLVEDFFLGLEVVAAGRTGLAIALSSLAKLSGTQE